MTKLKLPATFITECTGEYKVYRFDCLGMKLRTDGNVKYKISTYLSKEHLPEELWDRLEEMPMGKSTGQMYFAVISSTEIYFHHAVFGIDGIDVHVPSLANMHILLPEQEYVV